MNVECHCKNIKITISELSQELTSCNCSICRRYSSLRGYYHPEQVNVEIGDAEYCGYLWNDKCIEFIHCSNCGCVTHYQTLQDDPSPRIAVNFRMAASDAIEGINIRYFNGAAM